MKAWALSMSMGGDHTQKGLLGGMSLGGWGGRGNMKGKAGGGRGSMRAMHGLQYHHMVVPITQLSSCRALQHLDVSSNQLQAATCAALGHVVSAGCHLHHLRLDRNPMSKQASLYLP